MVPALALTPDQWQSPQSRARVVSWPSPRCLSQVDQCSPSPATSPQWFTEPHAEWTNSGRQSEEAG
jgi:hypothetical protein